MSYNAGLVSTKGDIIGISGTADLEWVKLTDRQSSIVGYRALFANSTGVRNTILGYDASFYQTSIAGNNNVIVGTYAAYRNQGDENTYVGTAAACNLVAGARNTYVGYRAGADAAAGLSTRNTFLGHAAGSGTAGSNNTLLGAGADGGAYGAAGNTAVGADARATAGSGTAVGAAAESTGERSAALGAAAKAHGHDTFVIGNNVISSGSGSLIIHPRADGLPAAYTADEVLDVYGVLRGARDVGGNYGVSLTSDRVTLTNTVNRVALQATGIEIYSDTAASVLCPLIVAQGMRVVGGSASFDAPAVFQEAARFNGAVSVAGAFAIDNLTANRAEVTGPALFSGAVGFDAAARFAAPAFFEAEGLSAAFAHDARVGGGLSVGGDLALGGALSVPDLETARLRVTEAAVFDNNVGFPAGLTAAAVTAGGLVASNVNAAAVRAGLAVVDQLVINDSISLPPAIHERDSHVRADLTVDGFLRCASNVLVEGWMDVRSGLDVHGGLDVLGGDLLLLGGGLEVRGGGAAFGALSAETLTITDALIVDATFCNTGTAYFNDLEVAGRAHVVELGADKLVVDRDFHARCLATFASNVYIDGNLVVAGNIAAAFGTISAASAAFGALSADSAALDDLTCDNALVRYETVGLNAHFSNLYADAAAFCNVAVGYAEVSDLHVTGQATIAGVDVLTLLGQGSSNAVFETVTATRLITSNGDAVIEGNLTVLGQLYANINVDLGYIVDNAIIFEHTVTVQGALSATRELSVQGAAAFGSNVYVGGDLVATDFIRIQNSLDRDSYWDIRLLPSQADPAIADIQLASWKSTAVTFTELFSPGLLNFTGSHRCSHPRDEDFDWRAHVGRIVVSTGVYSNLDGDPTVGIDEAVPVVDLCAAERDPRVFGVLAASEDRKQAHRCFELGNLRFSHPKTTHKLVVNSVGEGGIWVCGANGPLMNGDLICSSSYSGMGMRQGDDIVRSYTVAKITCDCDFGDAFRSFVGCIYMC